MPRSSTEPRHLNFVDFFAPGLNPCGDHFVEETCATNGVVASNLIPAISHLRPIPSCWSMLSIRYMCWDTEKRSQLNKRSQRPFGTLIPRSSDKGDLGALGIPVGEPLGFQHGSCGPKEIPWDFNQASQKPRGSNKGSPPRCSY